MELDALINRFRVASRELFNGYFRVDDPHKNPEAWTFDERHGEIEQVLFEKMVLEPADLPSVDYGFANPNILVQLKSDFAPIMFNREINSGYWDHPLREVTNDAKLVFVSFFDWDDLDYRDNRYVRVIVKEWLAYPEMTDKHALLESQYARFIKG
mgnify:FL=1